MSDEGFIFFGICAALVVIALYLLGEVLLGVGVSALVALAAYGRWLLARP